jgi:hypothetical protein
MKEVGVGISTERAKHIFMSLKPECNIKQEVLEVTNKLEGRWFDSR